MNSNGIKTTLEEALIYGLNEYKYLDTPGEYIVTLKHRSWGKKHNLGCCFETDDGKKFRLYVWFNENTNGAHFSPKNSSIDFSTVNDDTKWKITTSTTCNGKVKWDNAEII